MAIFTSVKGYYASQMYLFYSIKKKFCLKCFDPYPKSCAFAMRFCFTKYGSINLSSRRAMRDNRYHLKTSCRKEVRRQVCIIQLSKKVVVR
jgi:hypothetical protein